jgi:hypothetical protein
MTFEERTEAGRPMNGQSAAQDTPPLLEAAERPRPWEADKEDGALEAHLLHQGIMSLGPASNSGSGLTQTRQRAIACGVVNGLDPRDFVGQMLGVQLLACHQAAMKSFELAAHAERPGGSLAREHLTHAGKLSRTFVMLLAALGGYRSRDKEGEGSR